MSSSLTKAKSDPLQQRAALKLAEGSATLSSLGLTMGEGADLRTEHSERSLLEADPVIEAYKQGIDRSLLRENLKLTAEQRFLKLRELQRLAAELRKARRAGTP